MFDTTTTDASTMTDAQVAAALSQAQFEARQLYQQAVAAPWAPVNTLKATRAHFPMDAPPPVPMLPARARRALYEQALTVAQEAVRFFADFLREHAARSPAEREQVWARDRQPAPPPSPAAVAYAVFDARAFLTHLARRGIGLSAREDGKLHVTGLLSDNDRHMLRTHKAAIAEALATSAEVF